jgi:hypothetical protein
VGALIVGQAASHLCPKLTLRRARSTEMRQEPTKAHNFAKLPRGDSVRS